MNGCRLLLLILLLSLGSCASMFSPYESDPPCPGIENGGSCGSVIDGYKESVQQSEENNPGPDSNEASLHTKLSYQKLNSLLQQPDTPLIAPPKLIRIYVAPYYNEAQKSIIMGTHIFMIVEEAKFVFQAPR